MRALIAVGLAAAAVAVTAQQPARVDFGRDVQPIFRQQCYGCHGPAVHQGGLRLDRRADAKRGGSISDIGADSNASHLYRRVAGIESPQMPPTGALKPEQIEIIKNWIDQGAEWPDELAGDVAPKPTPPLMAAIEKGDAAAIRRLLDDHADVNATNDAGATALMRAVSNADAALVRTLIDRGANVNAKSDEGRTALLVASGLHGGLPIVSTLLEHGADPSVKAAGFGGETNPLTEAAWIGDIDTMRALAAKGADLKSAGFVALAFSLHAGCRACYDLLLPAMDQQAITYAPLVLIAPEDDGRLIKPLIERGADVGFVDGAGRSVLMRLVHSDTPSLEIVQAVIAKGVDVNYANPKDNGATALSVARLRGNTPIVDALVKAGARAPETDPAPSRPLAAKTSARAAIELALPLLQQNDVTFLKKTGCVSCHNNTYTAMAVSLARSHDIRVDEEIAQSQLDAIGSYLDGWRERALQGVGIPGEQDTFSAILLGLSAEGFAQNETTDAIARFIRGRQMADGHWTIVAHRPPIESNDIQVTANSLRALQVYGPRARRADYDAAIAKAATWLQRAQPRVNEEYAYQLLGLAWSRATKPTIQKVAKALIAQQRQDGGWAQLPTLSSDAYATGQALVALEQTGAITAADPVYRRGVEFLLRTQLADGSWYVKSRAIPIQPYFESGFPHGHDQFISAAASNWATMALTAAVKPAS